MKLKWRRQLLLDYRNCFGSPGGKRVLADLRKKCPLLTEATNASGGVDVNKLLIRTGEANVLKYVYKMLGRDPNEEAVEHARNETGERQ
jgi:hypothetical protein